MKGRLENQIKTEEKISKLIRDNDEIFEKYMLNLNTNTATTKYNYLSSILYFFGRVNKLGPRNVTVQQLKGISREDIQKFLESDKYYKAKTGEIRLKSPATVAREIAVLKNFFQFCVSAGYIETNPVDGIKNPKRNNEVEVTYMNPEEIREVSRSIRQCHGTTERVSKIYQDWMERDLAILDIGCTMGLRVTAISEINVEDVDFDEMIITVTEKGNVCREVYMGQETAEQILKWMAAREELLGDKKSDALFISNQRKRISTDMIAKIIERNTKGLSKHITPHKMRSSCATNLYNQTGDIYLVKDVLGHKNIANTQRYTKQSQSKMRQAASVLNNLL